MTLQDVRSRLEALSQEVTVLIRRYGLDAASPLLVIENAREKITEPSDYVTFLELSLEGRILADEGARLMKIESTLN